MNVPENAPKSRGRRAQADDRNYLCASGQVLDELVTRFSGGGFQQRAKQYSGKTP
jgi:hypothetical protein